MTEIERLAKAAAVESYVFSDPPNKTDAARWEACEPLGDPVLDAGAFRAIVRAILQAMREPSEGTLKAVDHAMHLMIGPAFKAKLVWQNGIDHLLSEPDK